MIDKNFMDMIYRADGGKFGAELYQKIKAEHSMTFEEMLQPFIDYMMETIPKAEYGNMITYLDTNYSVYVEESYKAGFNDCMRYLMSLKA